MIDVSDILGDSDFATKVTVSRSSGVFALGGFQSSSSTLTISAVVNTASGNELKQLDEADRIEGAVTIYSTQPLYVTRAAGQTTAAGVSDIVTYQGCAYRLAKVSNRSANGFYKAIGVRTRAA